MENTKMSPPWIELTNKLIALFGQDPEIQIVPSNDYDEEKKIKLLVANTDKAAALEKILPTQKTYGNITVHIIIVPANPLNETKASLFRTAFKGNPAVKDILNTNTTFDMTYVMFERKVIQYFNDNLGDPYGNVSTLFQNIATDVFEEHENVFFSTDSKG